MDFLNIKMRYRYIKDDVSINCVRVVQFGMNLRNSKSVSHFERVK